MEGYAGQALILELSLVDRSATKFPRARVFNAAGSLVAGPFSLTAVAGAAGLYKATWTPGAAGYFVAFFDVFDDAGFTIPAPYDVASEPVRIHALQQDLSFQKLLGHSGENVRDDVLAYDGLTNRPLTFRRRIFPDAATAAASTPGGTGEGEILTVTGTATHFDAARWETLLRTAVP